MVLEDDFEIPTHSAAPLEPRAALASWNEDDDTDLTVWKTTRGVHVDRDALAGALGLSANRVRVVGPFPRRGLRQQGRDPAAGIAAVLSQRAGRPVRLEYSREDEFIAGRVRHATKIHIRAGFKADGSITAIEASALLDTGAYIASGAGVARRARGRASCTSTILRQREVRSPPGLHQPPHRRLLPRPRARPRATSP